MSNDGSHPKCFFTSSAVPAGFFVPSIPSIKSHLKSTVHEDAIISLNL
jgi:hypothetical protein